MAKRTWKLPKRLIDIHSHLGKDDRDGSKAIEVMDKFNIEARLVMGLPWKTEAAARSNECCLRASHKYPGRLVAGVCADPREGRKAIDLIRSFHDEGVRVVKLFPNLGYFPDDPGVRPFFDAVAELRMAVLSHCGWLMPMPGQSYASYYSHPGRFEKLVRIYPDTIFIFAHMGGIAGFLETIMLTTRTPNAYVDTAPGQGLWVLESAGPMAASVPPAKLMWGDDSMPLPEYRDCYVKALAKIGYGPHFDKIFYANARGILERIGALAPGKPAAPKRPKKRK